MSTQHNRFTTLSDDDLLIAVQRLARAERHAPAAAVSCVAGLLGWNDAQVCLQAGSPLLLESSIKRALDIDWNDAVEKREAMTTFARQLDALQSWIAHHLPEESAKPPLKEPLATLVQIQRQDLEPDPQDGRVRIRQGVAEDRRVSTAGRVHSAAHTHSSDME